MTTQGKMIYQTSDPDVLDKAVGPYPEMLKGYVATEWLETKGNIALTDDAGNVGLLVYNLPGIYCGHYFFSSRGKEAIKRVSEMISYAFTEQPVRMIIGVTPEDNLRARWMNRKMGFTSGGVIETLHGNCEVVSLTREEFERNKSGLSNR